MARTIAFLRAINVGGRTVKMSQLVTLFESMGYNNVETFIASGNVIFTSTAPADLSMAHAIEHALHQRLGFEVTTFVRSTAELSRLANLELFSVGEREAAHSLSVGMLSEPIADAARLALPAFDTEHESFRAMGREIHYLAHVSVSQSRFSLANFERRLGVRVTFRNINTLKRLVKKYPSV